MRLAGIDIGTLTCRLLVADVSLPHEFKEIDTDRRILRLGEGVDQHKQLSPQAMDRVVATLKERKTCHCNQNYLNLILTDCQLKTLFFQKHK